MDEAPYATVQFPDAKRSRKVSAKAKNQTSDSLDKQLQHEAAHWFENGNESNGIVEGSTATETGSGQQVTESCTDPVESGIELEKSEFAATDQYATFLKHSDSVRDRKMHLSTGSPAISLRSSIDNTMLNEIEAEDSETVRSTLRETVKLEAKQIYYSFMKKKWDVKKDHTDGMVAAQKHIFANCEDFDSAKDLLMELRIETTEFYNSIEISDDESAYAKEKEAKRIYYVGMKHVLSKSMDESKLKMFSKVYQKQALEYIIDACDDFDQATICLQNTGRTIRDFMTSLEEFTHFVLPISSSSLRKF